MKVAIVHDYFFQAGGAERVVESLLSLFPGATLYSTFFLPERMWPGLRDVPCQTSWMQRLPYKDRLFRAYLPLYGRAVESLDLGGFDLVVSSSSAFAKAAVPRGDARHVCYCHTPMRFAWQFGSYVERERFGIAGRVLLPPVIKRLRSWDFATVPRVTTFVANSSAVRDRIRRCYGRDAEVVFPPVDVARFAPAASREDYYLAVARLVPYKRLDLAVEAMSRMGRRLIVVGEGPAMAALRRSAGPSISFAGRLDDARVTRLYSRARGFVFPGEEDFGIAPLEANASGAPVIAYAGGGALDTVVDGRTGVLFSQQTVEDFCEAVERAESMSWDVTALTSHAAQFSERHFHDRFRAVVERTMSRRQFDNGPTSANFARPAAA